MSRAGRRRRALILLSLALASGGLAASQVSGTVQRVEARIGRPVPVVVARHELAAGSRLAAADLAVREVPERFVPRDALSSPAEAAGARTAIRLPSGGYLTASALAGEARRRGPGLPRGQRAVEVAVAGGGPLADGAGPGTRVDVVVSTEPHAGEGRTFVALQDVQLLALRSGGDSADAGGAKASADAVATLRVSLRQAVYLTAAQNFARELRLLPRPPGDREHGGGAAFSSGEL
jgi:pilus assembly protein CpaB